TYFARDVRYSRAVLVLWAGCSFVLLCAARVLSKLLLRHLRGRGYNLRHVLVVGVGELSEHVVDVVHRQTSLGLRVSGVVGLDDEARLVGSQVDGVPVLGTVSQLGALLAGGDIDQVIIALPIHELGALKGIMDVLSKETVDVRLVPDFYQYMTLCGSVEEFSGLPIINLQSTPLLGWNLVIKRGFDVAAAVTGLILIAPLLAGIAALIRLSSAGPVFYRQERVGMDGQSFRMYKFRTMYTNAESAGARMTVKGDPRCTPVGAVLRRFSLDELPQLLNVLQGDMSLVGPRPERPCFIESFKQEIPRYALRHKIKAGMTGWAQVNGMRGNTCIAKRIELDLYYIENWSLLLDIKILLRTVLGGFLSPNAY
ncbi:MAG TPA: undecaprenyl-phosphate glucose phosphotransferase, partial [Myxococcota bacterium]|nr:undecaprenyl-phosphate glucose phosphotransferase [Myxococcota bacterium]